MGRIQSNIGLITGTDIGGTVDKLISLSAIPRDRLQARVESLRAQQVSLGELTALVIGVQLQASRIGSAANLSSVNVTSSNEDVLKGTATSSTLPGNYAIKTIATAQSSSQISSPFNSSTDKLTAGKLEVYTGGFLDNSPSLDSLRGGAGIERGQILITNRSGDSRTIDLRSAATIDDVAKAINQSDGLKVTAKVSGDQLVLSDISGGTTSNLIVSEVNGGRTAAELGFVATNVAADSVTGDKLSFLGNSTLLSSLRDNRGIDLVTGIDLTIKTADGSELNIDFDDAAPPKRVREFLSLINSNTDGKIEARIAADRVSIEIIDKTTGAGTFSASGKVAAALGIAEKTAAAGVLGGDRIQSSLSGTLLSSLDGGKGLGQLGTLAITNRAGVATSIDLSDAVSLNEVIDTINNSAAGVTAGLNKSRTGIVLKDVSGSTANNFIVADGDATNTATKLSLVIDDSVEQVDSGTLGAQFISRSTTLSSLNRGTGVRSGSFTITNAAGRTSGINFAVLQPKTVGDVIDAINKLNIDVTAQFNDDGDGFVLVDNSGGTGTLTITDSGTGSAAKDLGIAGSAKEIVVNGVTKSGFESKQNLTIQVAIDDTLDSVVKKLQATNSSINASLLNVGEGSVRLLLNAKSTGLAGRVYVDGAAVGIDTTQTAQARDAVIAIGAGEQTAGTLITSSNNQFKDVLPGLSFEVLGVSSDIINVSAERSFSKIESNLKLFVEQYNKVIDKIATETRYDPITNTTGNLFGTGEVLRVQQSLSRIVNTRNYSTGSIQTLDQLGIQVNEGGKLTLDSTRLNNAIAQDPASVEKYLSDEKLGVVAKSKQLFDNLVSVDNGLLVSRNNALQRNVESQNDRIANLNLRLDRERTRLTKQFIGMETAIQKIQANFSGLNLSIYDSLFGNSN